MNFEDFLNKQPEEMGQVSRLTIIASQKGGIGKTMTAAAALTCGLLRQLDVHVLELDQQAGLHRRYPDRVEVIQLATAEALREDDVADVRALSPAYERIVSGLGGAPRPLIVDIGANLEERTASVLARLELDDDLVEARAAATVLVPVTVDEQAIELAGRTARIFEKVLPSARIILVLNNGFGRFEDLPPQGEVALLALRELGPFAKRFGVVRLPALGRTSARLVTNGDLNLLEIAVASVAELVSAWGEPAALAKSARVDICVWVERAGAALAPALGFPAPVE